MAWSLPDLELAHVWSTSKRVWSMWGTDTILASAGADPVVTIRSLSTGAILHYIPTSGPIFSLWGPGTLSLNSICLRVDA